MKRCITLTKGRLFTYLLLLVLVVSFCFPTPILYTKSKIKLNKSKLTLTVGKKITLKVKGISKKKAKKVKWKSSKKKVASVSKKGVVSAKKAGKAKVTAVYLSKKLSCKVTVKKKRNAVSTPKATPTTTPKVTNTPCITSTPTPMPTPTPTPKPEPAFSKESGCYKGDFELELTAPEGSTIYYTTDGSVPISGEEENSASKGTNVYKKAIQVTNRDSEANLLCSEKNIPLMYPLGDVFYPQPEAVPKATVIRALAVDKNGKQSKVVSKVFYVNKDFKTLYPNASVLSVIMDPDDLLNSKTGIMYMNNAMEHGKEWERKADIIYMEEDGSIPVDATVGIRIHGGYSRNWGQKSFRLYFREEYGQKNIKKYQLIPGAMNHDRTDETTKYKKLILRNGGNDWAYTKFQDILTQKLVENRAFATQTARPCVMYLNGEFWGLYNLTERYSDDYLETEFGIEDKSNTVIVKNGEVDSDDEEADTSYYEDYKKLRSLDMTKEENFAVFKEKVDYQSFLDYFATEVYIANKDWPENNFQMWRTKEMDGTKYGDTKWRYMLYDTDFGMNLYGSSENEVGNAIEWAKKDKVFAAVVKNKQFQQDFAETLVEITNENFATSISIPLLKKYAQIYQPLMMKHQARFGPDYVSFESEVSRIETFLNQRASKIKQYIRKSFGITVK